MNVLESLLKRSEAKEGKADTHTHPSDTHPDRQTDTKQEKAHCFRKRNSVNTPVVSHTGTIQKHPYIYYIKS